MTAHWTNRDVLTVRMQVVAPNCHLQSFYLVFVPVCLCVHVVQMSLHALRYSSRFCILEVSLSLSIISLLEAVLFPSQTHTHTYNG